MPPVPASGGDLDDATPVWVGHPLQATENEPLKMGMRGGIGRFSFQENERGFHIATQLTSSHEKEKKPTASTVVLGY